MYLYKGLRILFFGVLYCEFDDSNVIMINPIFES